MSVIRFQLKDVSLYNWNFQIQKLLERDARFQLKDVSLYNWNFDDATRSFQGIYLFQLKDVSLYNWNDVKFVIMLVASSFSWRM